MEHLVSVRPSGWDFSLKVPERHLSWYQTQGYEPLSAGIFSSSALGVDLVLDIGAHMGFYSMVALSATRGNVPVISIEASPLNYETLTENLGSSTLFSKARTLLGAFGKERKTRRIQLTEASDNCGLSGHPNSPTQEILEVPGITVEELEVDAGKKVLAKVDVEGHEVEAVESLLALRERSSSLRLIVEFDPKALRQAGSSPGELLNLLRNSDFRVFVVDDLELTVSEWLGDVQELEELVGERYVNLYCLPKAEALSVLSFLHSDQFNGAERSHIEVVQDLIAEGAVVHTEVPGGDGAILPLLTSAGSSIGAYPSQISWWAYGGGYQAESDAMGALMNQDAWEWIFEKEWSTYDVVITQTSVIYLGALTAAALETPHVWWIREFGDLDHQLTYPAPPKEMGTLISQLSNEVWTNSEAVLKHFFADNPPSVEVMRPHPRSKAIEVSTETVIEPVLGVIGSLNPRKGHDTALWALHLLKQRGLRIRMKFRGGGSPSNVERLKDLVNQLGLSEEVQFEGPFRNENETYSGLTAVVVPSYLEAFGRVPSEATSAGLPVIYANSGGLAEQLTHGQTGLSFEPGDAEDLAEQISLLLESSDLQKDLVENASRAFLDGSMLRSSRANMFRRLKAVSLSEDLPHLSQALSNGARGFIREKLRGDAAVSERDAAVSERDALQLRLQTIEATRSWRWTKILRRLF